MGTSTTVATGRFGRLARLAVALGFAVTLLVGQAVVFDNPASAKMSAAQCAADPEGCLFEMEGGG